MHPEDIPYRSRSLCLEQLNAYVSAPYISKLLGLVRLPVRADFIHTILRIHWATDDIASNIKRIRGAYLQQGHTLKNYLIEDLRPAELPDIGHLMGH